MPLRIGEEKRGGKSKGWGGGEKRGEDKRIGGNRKEGKERDEDISTHVPRSSFLPVP